MVTCEAVFTEAMYLLRRVARGQEALWGLLEQKGIQIQFSLQDELTAIKKLMLRYRNVPMDLADACLVRMHELKPYSKILTLDSDFLIYRRYLNKPLAVVCPAT